MTVQTIPSTSALTQLYEGLSTDTKPTASVVAYALFKELDTGDVYEYSGLNWDQIVSGGAARVRDINAIPSTTYTANFFLADGAATVLPANPCVITGSSIPHITAVQVPASSRRIHLISAGTVGGPGGAGDYSNVLGWAVVLNAPTVGDAEAALEAGLDTGDDMLSYAGTVNALNDNNAIIIVPVNFEAMFEALYDITTVHVVPLATATTSIGGATLSATLMPAPAIQ